MEGSPAQLSLVPAALDISIYQGSSQSPLLTAYNTDQYGNNTTPFDFTNYTAVWSFFLPGKPDTPFLTLSTANSKLVLGGNAGTIRPLFVPADTLGQSPGAFEHDLTFTSPSGDKMPWLSGVFQIVERGTQ